MRPVNSPNSLESRIGKIVIDGLGDTVARQLLETPGLLVTAAATALATRNALDAAPKRSLVGEGLEEAITPEERLRLFQPMLIEGDWKDVWPDDELLTTEEAAKRCGVSVQTIVDWINKGKLIGLKRRKRGYRVPARQIMKDGRPVDGLEAVVAEISIHNAAWAFLTTTFPFDSTDARPLDVLKFGKIQRVVEAARGWGQGDFL